MTLSDFAARAANRSLEGESWARERLAAHAGASFVFEAGPLGSAFTIAADGTLAAAPRDLVPSLVLRIPPLDLPDVLADPSRWRERVRAEGDPALAATIEDLALTLPWFVERAFARALGPIAGQRLADAGRALLAFPGEASRRAAAGFARYASEEADLVANRDDARSFAAEVQALAARVDALAARVDRLATDRGR